jgi:hypothetical protein
MKYDLLGGFGHNLHIFVSAKNNQTKCSEHLLHIMKYCDQTRRDLMCFKDFTFMSRLLRPSRASLLSQCSSYAQIPSLSVLSDKESSVGTLQESYTLLQQRCQLPLFVS